MNTLIRGCENVKRVQEALGGPVPREAQSKSLASLRRIAKERFSQAEQRRAKVAELQAQAQAPLLAFIQQDKKAAASVKKLRDLPLLIPAQPGCPPAPPFVMESSLRRVLMSWSGCRLMTMPLLMPLGQQIHGLMSRNPGSVVLKLAAQTKIGR